MGRVKPHPILTASPEQVDLAMLEDFLSLAIAENLTIEYKREGDSAIDSVAALANTYGGFVFYGIERPQVFEELPGNVTGVSPREKARIVNKIATTLDAPWWSEIVPIPTGQGDKVVLLIRVDADTAPRPVLHGGAIRIRLDGRDDVADRRLARALFEESDVPSAADALDPRRSPDQHKSPFGRLKPPPHVVVRAICTQSLRGGPARPRLGPAAYAGAAYVIHPTSDPELWQLFTSGYPGVPVNNAELDTRLTTRFMRISAGHGLESRPPAEGVRVECGIQLGGAGRRESMELWADALLWKPLHVRIPGDLVIQAAHVMTGLLAKRLHPEITSAVLGNLQVPVPPVELHIAGGGTVSARGNLMDGPLETLIVLDSFGAL